MNIDGANIDDTERLRILREMECEETEANEAMQRRYVVDPRIEETADIDQLALQRMLSCEWLARIQTIRPEEFRYMTPAERRTWADRAERFAKRFTSISRWMGLNAGPKPEVPDYLRAAGGA